MCFWMVSGHGPQVTGVCPGRWQHPLVPRACWEAQLWRRVGACVRRCRVPRREAFLSSRGWPEPRSAPCCVSTVLAPRARWPLWSPECCTQQRPSQRVPVPGAVPGCCCLCSGTCPGVAVTTALLPGVCLCPLGSGQRVPAVGPAPGMCAPGCQARGRGSCRVDLDHGLHLRVESSAQHMGVGRVLATAPC